MKNRLLMLVVLLLPVSLLVYFVLRPVAEKKPAGLENKLSAGEVLSNSLARQNPKTIAIIESNFARVVAAPAPVDSAASLPVTPAGPPQPLEFTNFAPATVVANVRHAVRQYGEMFGGNPVGDNAEITGQLNGSNPRHINFISAEAGMRLNGNGELIDAWGTPYFFHQLSTSDMEIHSAGPDRVMWTYDDIVAH